MPLRARNKLNVCTKSITAAFNPHTLPDFALKFSRLRKSAATLFTHLT
jgi:hypothetical protein